MLTAPVLVKGSYLSVVGVTDAAYEELELVVIGDAGHFALLCEIIE